ncbi:MAG: hypothetical protein L0241_20230, partial [Planctomycetia bacterium]|nr:hypothetical protein [Planctomycetia bacterium]
LQQRPLLRPSNESAKRKKTNSNTAGPRPAVRSFFWLDVRHPIVLHRGTGTANPARKGGGCRDVR